MLLHEDLISCLTSIALLWTILVYYLWEKVCRRNSEFVPSMAPIYFRPFSVWKYEAKVHYNVFLTWQLDQLKRCQPVKVLPTKKGCSSQNETDTPTNFRGVTSYTPTETASGRTRLWGRICAEIMYTVVHNAVMIRILMLTNSYNAELLKD